MHQSAETGTESETATGAADAALAAAFHATCYRVAVGEGSLFDLRIGVAQPALAAWLHEQRVARWAIVSAHNPGACRLSPNDNDERDARLCERLRQAGWRHARSVALADAGDWPAEPGYFVVDAPLAALLALAADFGQAAIVCGEGEVMVDKKGSAEALPRLLWLAAAESLQTPSAAR